MEQKEQKDKRFRPTDVIAQFSHDGEIVPIKVRFVDEDGLRQKYKIKEYRDLSHQGTKTMPDGVYVTDTTLIFECKILVFDRIRVIRLYYEPGLLAWKMTG